MTRGLVTVAQNADPESSVDLTNNVESGTSTKRLMYVHVMPMAKPKPGNTLCRFDRIVIPS